MELLRRHAIAGGVMLGLSGIAEAQTQKKARVGFLAAGDALTMRPRIEALRQGLAAYGYVEPATLTLTVRLAEGRYDRLAALAQELARLAPDVVVVSGTRSVRAQRDASPTIPIVVATATDLVGGGLAASLARPGGTITGLTLQRLDTIPKEVQLVAELVPAARRIGVLRGPAGGAGDDVFAAIRDNAARESREVLSYTMTRAEEAETAFKAMVGAGIGAVMVVDGPLLETHRSRIAAAGISSRLPLFASSSEYVHEGALASYGASRRPRYQRAAYFVDRIVQGASPADLPIEQPTTFELVINLQTARSIGLNIPPLVLARADEVLQ